MNNIMRYKGYWARVQYSDEDECFWGEIEGLKNTSISFEGNTVKELKNLLNKLGFFENNKGKIFGSRVEFKDKYERKIILHKPHPNNIIKMYMINTLLNYLEKWRII